MAFLQKKNNAISSVNDNPLLIGATTLNVPSGHGARFPAVGDFMLTLWDADTYADPKDDPNMEIVRATDRVDDAITIIRAQEGTSAVQHAQGTTVAMLITAGVFDDLADQGVKTTDDVVFNSIATGQITLGSLNGFLKAINGLFGTSDIYLTDLADAPSSYTGQGGKTVKVKADESGIEFVSSTGVSVSIGDEVIGGAPGNYLYVDGSGNLAQTSLDTNYLPLSGGTMSGGVIMGQNGITFEEMTTPSSPGADQAILFATDDGGVTKLAIKDSAGSVTILGSGGGGGAVDSVFGRTGSVVAATNDYTWAQIDKTTSDIADITSRSHTDLTDIGTNTHAQIDTHIADTSNPHSVTAAQTGAVALTGNESVAGVKTFTSFPVLPSTNPTTDYQAAHKKYIDDLVSLGISWKPPVINVNQNTPPGSPTLGDRYTIGNSPTGAWSGQADNIAEWNGSSWEFTAAGTGDAVLNLTDELGYTYNGTTWVAFSSVGVLTGSNGISVVGQDARLGGTLTANTTINQGAYNFIFNLDGVGDFAIQDSGVAAFQVDDSGFTRIGSAITNLGQLAIQPTDATRRGLVIRGAASQTGQLFLLENSAGTDLAAWSASGKFTSALTSVDDTTTQFNLSQTALIHQQQSNTGSWFALTSQYAAVKFTAASAFYIYTVAAYLRASGTVSNPTATITAYIYSDNAGVPGTNLDTGQAIRVGSVTTSASGAKYQFGAFTTTTTAAADYWLVLRFSAVPAGADIEWQGAATGTNIFSTSSDGSSWSTVSSISPRYTIEGRTGVGIAVSSPNNIAGSFTSINTTAVSASSTNGTGISATSVNGTGMSASSTYGNAIVGSSTSGIGISATTQSGDAMRATSTTGRGIFATTTSGVAITATSTTGTSASFSTTSGVGMIVTANPATTDTVHEMLRITRNTSGTAANGIGSRLSFYLEDGVGSSQLSGGFDFILTDVTNGAEDSAIAFFIRNNGVVVEGARLDNTSKFNAKQLESTATTGTAPFVVASTTVSTNLNADLLDGQHASAFQPTGNYITALTGDVTASGPGPVAATLATVNSNVGSFGSGSQVATFTVNAKGLITAAGNTSISITASQVSDFDTEVGNNTDVAANTAARHNAVTLGTANGLSLNIQELSLALASTSTTGALSSTDWNTFNGKQAALTIGNLSGTTNQVNVTGGTGAIIGSGVTLSLPQNIDTGASPTFANLTLSTNFFFSGAGNHYIKHNSGTASTDGFIFRFSDNEDVVIIRGDGRVGINNMSPAQALDVTGSVQASTSIISPILSNPVGGLLFTTHTDYGIGYAGANAGGAKHEFYGSMYCDNSFSALGSVTCGGVLSSGLLSAVGSADTWLWIDRSSSIANETSVTRAAIITHYRNGNDTNSSSLTYYGIIGSNQNAGTYNPSTSGQTRTTYGIKYTASDTGNSGTGTPHTKLVIAGDFAATNTGSVTSGAGLRNTYALRGVATGSSDGTSEAVGVYGVASGADTNWAGFFDGLLRVTDYMHVNPAQSWVFNDQTIFEYGEDSGYIWDGTPAGLYWSNADYGNNQFELRTRGGSFLNFQAANLIGSYLYSSGSGFIGTSLTVVNTTSIGSGATQGVIDFNSTTANRIQFGTAGVAAPGASSAGMKIKLYGTDGVMGASDYAIGIESGTIWFNSDSAYSWYRDSSNRVMHIDGSGNVGIGSSTSLSALLHVQGNGYFTGNVGIGIVPTSRLHVSTTTSGQQALTVVSNVTAGGSPHGFAIDYDTNFLSSGSAQKINYDSTSTSFGGSSTVFDIDANHSGNAMNFIGMNITLTQSGGSGANAIAYSAVIDDCSSTATGFGATINNANVAGGAAIYGTTLTASAAMPSTSGAKFAVYGEGRNYFTLDTTYNAVSVDADNVATFLNGSSASDEAEVSIIAGTAGQSWLNFGDTADEDVGYIVYNHTSNYLAIGTNTAEEIRILSTGLVGFSVTNPLAGLHINSSTTTLQLTDNETNANTKQSSIAGNHYTNAEEPVLIAYQNNNSTSNVLRIGGGVSAYNTVTNVEFYTASNITTVTGSRRFRIDGAGRGYFGSTNNGAGVVTFAVEHGDPGSGPWDMSTAGFMVGQYIDDSSTAAAVYIGYTYDPGVGFIQSMVSSIGVRPLSLQNQGSSVLIGQIYDDLQSYSRLQVYSSSGSASLLHLASIGTAYSTGVHREFKQNRVTTTDATVTTIYTYGLTNNHVYGFNAKIVARRTGGASGTDGDGAYYEMSATFRRNSAGTVAQIGSTTYKVTHESQAGWNADFAISGTNIIVRVTGAASNNVTWALDLEVKPVA